MVTEIQTYRTVIFSVNNSVGFSVVGMRVITHVDVPSSDSKIVLSIGACKRCQIIIHDGK